ncbi:hypothetical protein Tco_0256561 [Tanacetum coccineum]
MMADSLKIHLVNDDCVFLIVELAIPNILARRVLEEGFGGEAFGRYIMNISALRSPFEQVKTGYCPFLNSLLLIGLEYFPMIPLDSAVASMLLSKIMALDTSCLMPPLENLEPVLRDDIRKVSIVLSPVPQKISCYSYRFLLEIIVFMTRNMLTLYVELDVPGHAESWGVGYPALCPSKNCREPLDVSSDCTLKLINGVLSGLSNDAVA